MKSDVLVTRYENKVKSLILSAFYPSSYNILLPQLYLQMPLQLPVSYLYIMNTPLKHEAISFINS